MIKFGKGVVKNRVLIIILSVLLLIPAGISFINTRINFDILSYLPGEIETMKGQDILVDELPENMREQLKLGVGISTEEELYDFLESYSS